MKKDVCKIQNCKSRQPWALKVNKSYIKMNLLIPHLLTDRSKEMISKTMRKSNLKF